MQEFEIDQEFIEIDGLTLIEEKIKPLIHQIIAVLADARIDYPLWI